MMEAREMFGDHVTESICISFNNNNVATSSESVRAHPRSTEAHVRLGFVGLSGPLGPGGLRRNSPFGTLAMALRAT